MPNNPNDAPTDAEIGELIDRHKLPITDRNYEGLIAYIEQIGLDVEKSNYRLANDRGAWHQQVKLTDLEGNQAFGLSDNIDRSVMIATDRYLNREFGRNYW